MNKIFKVVWSKTKECYVVVSEVAKNNSGKKKVLASVLAALAVVGAGAAGTPVQAGGNYGNSAVNIAPDNLAGSNYANAVSKNSVVVGYQNDSTGGPNNESGKIIYGANNTANRESSLAIGNQNTASHKSTSAIGVGNTASGEASVALGNANTASGDRSIAIGSGAEASKNNAVAIGRVSKATGTSATALGVNNKAQADDSSAVGSSNTIAAAATQASAFGRENTINRAGAFAAGYKNTTNGERNVAVGSENTTTGEDSIGIGTKVIAGTGKTIAIGSVASNDGTTLQTIARGNDTINTATGQVNNIFALAIGNGAQADGKAKSASGMIAIGQEVLADNNNTVAIGVKTKATGNNGLAVGSYTQALGVSSAAFGTQAIANGTGATAFGPGASAGTDTVGANGSVAVGRKAAVTAEGGVGIGWTASASEKNATAIGFSATASGVQSVAIGGGDAYDYPGTERGKHFTTASGKSSVAVGSYAKATEENAMAFGTDANANIAGGVALGSESKTTTAAGVQGYNPASDRTNKYSTQSGAVGTSTLAAVSIGDGSAKTRQLTGLAAGTADTDAVNVAQLKNVNLKYAGDTGNSDVLLKDGTLKVKGDNNFISTSADGTGITVTAKIGNPITANTAGKAEAPATNGLATTTNVADAINASGWNVVSSNNGGSVTGTQATKLVNPGNTVTLSAGKNIVLDQNDKQFTYSLNKDVDLTNAGSLTIGDTKITNGGLTITGGPSVTKTGIDAGSKKITNVTAGTADTDAVNVKQLKDTEKHIKPGTYAVANDGSVTLKYVDGNGTEQTETAKITGIAKKSKVINGQNTTVEEGTDTTDNSVTYKVNVKGDLADISSITNGTGSGKISFEGDQVVKVGGDHPISFDGKGGYVTGLQNKDWDITNPTVVSGRAATEDQLKKVSDGFNNTVKLTGNSGATGTQKLNQNGGLSFGVVGADNGKYITTTASGSNVVADLSTDAKAKLNSKVVVAGSGAATVAAPTVTTNADGSTVTTYTVHVDPATATAASTESVVKKVVTGDTNIADVSVADGKATGDVGAKYEVSVSRNAVKDAAREAVTVNNGGTTTGGTYTADTNNPITVNPVKDDTNHNTTYEVKFDGAKAAKVIPLTYKANSAGAKTVTLEKGLDFTNGTNTTAEIGNDGVVKYNLNKDVDLTKDGSLTIGDTKITKDGVTITGGPSVTKTGIDAGDKKITNVAPGTISSTSKDAVNGSQLYTVDQKFNNKINLGADTNETTKFQLDNAGGIKFNIKGDGSGTGGANQYISTTANGSNVNVDLTADAKAKLNKTYTVSSGSTNVTVTPTTVGDNTDFKITVASTGTTTSSSWNLNSGVVSTTEGTHAGDTTQNIADTKTVTMQAGKNLTVTQTNDGAGNASVAYSLDKDISVETVTVTGQNGKDGKIGIDGKDGVDGKDGKNRVEITVEKGAKGVDGTDGHDGVNGHNGKDGMTRIVYEDKGGKQEVATLNDGMKYAGDDAQGTDKTNVIAKKLNETLDIIGGANKADLTTDNIGVNNDGNGKLLVQLSKNLKGINTIKNGNTTITLNDTPSATTPAVTITGGNLSMGDGTTNNKIVNLAPGTDDNDAVNYKQLKAAKTEVKAGKNVVVTSETSTTDGHTTYTVNASTPAVYTKPDGTKLVKQPDGTFKEENGTAYTGTVIASFEDGTGATTGGNMIVNNIGSAIKTQTGGDFLTKLDNANTATPNAAVNVSDLKNTADALKSNELHIRPTTSGRTGETVNQGAGGTAESYKYDATTKSVTLKYNDGTGAGVTGTEAKIDLSDLANQITSGYTFKANATANGGTVANDATTPAVATTVENGGTINYAAGKNLTVKQDIDATAKTHTYTYSLNKDLTNLDKVVVNGENGTNGKDGVTIIGPQGATGATGMPGTNGIDGKVGISGKDGKDAVSISGKDGIGTIGLTGPQGPAGADGRGVDITTDHGTQTLNKPEANNGGKSERIVYVPKDKDGNPLKDDAGNTIKREVATMDDGLKFSGNNESTENKHKLGSLVKVKGEGVTEAQANAFTSAAGNIAVVADGTDTLTVKLNKNLAGINKISNGNSSITLNDTPSTTTPAVTISGGNLSMGDGTTNNKIVNVAPGTDDSDAVNYKQLKAAKTEVKAGKNVVVTSETSTTDGHTTYTVNASTPAVYTKPDGTKLVKQPDGTFKEENGTAYTGTVIASFEDGTGATTGGNMIVNNIGSAIKTQTGGDFLTKLDNANTATPNAAVNVSDLKSTADALKANERHIAPTTVATGSTETKGGTANAGGTANVYKYDATSKTVTLTYNDGNGNAVTDTKAVIDLSNLSTGGTGASSWNVKSSANTTDGGAVDVNHNANAQNIADGKSVEFQSGKNLVVKQTNDTTNGNATVEFSLSDNITVGKDGANGKDGSVGAKGADGSAVVMNGKDGSIGLNGTNGANGISIKGKDGANGVGIDGKDGVTRIVYTEKVPDPANPGTTKEVTHEVATMDDGLKFTGNNTATENKHKLGSLVKVQGEGVTAADEAAFQSASGNIAVTADGTDTLTIRLNKNLKGLNSIQLGGNTIQSNGDNITFTTNGGTTKTVATTDQLWTIQANGTDVPAKSGKVNLVAGDHITITPDAANGKMTISATGFGSMDGFNVKTSAESATVGTHAGDTTENIKNGKTVDMQAGKNLVVTQTNDGNGNTTVNYALNKDVDLGTNGSLKTGDTTVNKDGVTIANGPSITKTGVDAGNKKITNVADGDVNATSKDAVNGSQLKKYTDAAKTTVEAGDDNVKVETDNSAADGHTNYKVSLKPVVEIGDTHKVKIDGHTGDITGLTNVTLTDPTFATKGRAATEEQLDKVLTEAKKKAVEKVQAGTAAAGDTNIATVAPKAGDTFGAAGATYEVSVSKNAVKDAAKEAVKVTSASPAITVTADTSVAHETTYKVGFDGNQAATQIPLTYKQNGGSARTVKLSDGLNFIDGTNTKARTAADGKVTFDVMGDLTGITSISNAAGGPKMTFGGNSINVTNGDLNMGGNKITNLGKGTATTDAATVGQLTKVTSNNHSVVINKTTDANGAPVYDLAVTGTPGAPAADPRVDMLGEEIGRVGAQGAALSALKPIQYDPLEPTQIMAGYGNYRGNSAVALGVAHYKNESTLIHGGVSWAGGSSHMMANAGVTWKVGNRDSEAAVADRYRKGPISSAYAMQQEMAAMKAQNAGLKGEVSDLKAENEQMKAQIAAMMAKLGL